MDLPKIYHTLVYQMTLIGLAALDTLPRPFPLPFTLVPQSMIPLFLEFVVPLAELFTNTFGRFDLAPFDEKNVRFFTLQGSSSTSSIYMSTSRRLAAGGARAERPP